MGGGEENGSRGVVIYYKTIICPIRLHACSSFIQIKINYKNKYTLGPKTLLDMDIKFDNMYKVVHHSILLLSMGNQ